MEHECPGKLELKTSLQLRKLHKTKHPQPYHFICNECYMTLKSKTKIIFNKLIGPICHQDVKILNLEQIDECQNCEDNFKKTTKHLCCLFRKLQNVLLGNGH